MSPSLGVRLALQNGLDAVEQRCGDERLMNSGKHLSLHPYQPNVEGIIEHDRKARQRKWLSIRVVETELRHSLTESVQIVLSACIELECMPNQRSVDWVRYFGLSSALVLVTHRRSQRINALLQAAIDALSRFLSEISDEIGRHYCLNVGRQPSAAGLQIQALRLQIELLCRGL